MNDAGNTTTLGDWDSSAVRIDNLSGAPLTVQVTVDIPVAYPGSSTSNNHFDLWGTRTIPAGQSLILMLFMRYTNVVGLATIRLWTILFLTTISGSMLAMILSALGFRPNDRVRLVVSHDAVDGRQFSQG